MRQVPRYLIIGNGQMASHLCHYFRYLALPFMHWYRSAYSFLELHLFLKKASHVLILINDDAVDDFAAEHLAKYNYLECIHFSGVLASKFAYSAHPLCSFSGLEPYTLLDYQTIPFILDKESPQFATLLPGLQNPVYRIEPEQRQYYHAMCVIANNFTTILWDKFLKEMTNRFSINKNDLLPFLNKTFWNIKRYPQTKLTGPLARGDGVSLIKDLNALEQDDFHCIFNSFIEAYKEKDCDKCT